MNASTDPPGFATDSSTGAWADGDYVKLPTVPLTKARPIAPAITTSSTDFGEHRNVLCGPCWQQYYVEVTLGTLYREGQGLMFANWTVPSRGRVRRLGVQPFGERQPTDDGIRSRCRNGHDLRVGGPRLAQLMENTPEERKFFLRGS